MTIACALIGRLVRDAKVLQTKAGKPWISLSLKVEPADWVSVAYFGDISPLADLKEGDSILVEGRICLKKWNNHAGHQMAGLDVVASTIKQIDLTPRNPSKPASAREIASRSPFAPAGLDDPIDDPGSGPGQAIGRRHAVLDQKDDF